VACRQALRFAKRVERQRANSLQLLSHLDTIEDVVLPRERPGALYNYHMFPVLLRDRKERAPVMAAMWKRFVDTSMIYCDVAQQCRRFGYRGTCPQAESIVDRLITVPNHAALTNQDIDVIAQVFRSSLLACRNVKPSCFGLPVSVHNVACGVEMASASSSSMQSSLREPTDIF
jgi:dTDP-4-amino-4,6-dideoxygalactose transaminase